MFAAAHRRLDAGIPTEALRRSAVIIERSDFIFQTSVNDFKLQLSLSLPIR